MPRYFMTTYVYGQQQSVETFSTLAEAEAARAAEVGAIEAGVEAGKRDSLLAADCFTFKVTAEAGAGF